MNYSLSFKANSTRSKIYLPASKSIANRLLIMQALSNGSLALENSSTAEDTLLLEAALKSNESIINVGMAGTAYRFLTAYYACQKGKTVVLDGAERMHKRPIKLLVDVLRTLGADINYLKEEGFPPLKINGKQLSVGKISIDGSISSQYISAILMILPLLETDSQLELTGRVVSLPYIDLTIGLMKAAGIQVQRKDNKVKVQNGIYGSLSPIKVEADWSAAAFFYQFVALSDLSIELIDLDFNSLQGDQKTAHHFEKLGVKTEKTSQGLLLTKSTIPNHEFVTFDLVDCPDLIPAIAATAAQLIDKTVISGTSTLRIKESNRVEALQKELAKVNVELIDLEEDVIEIHKTSGNTSHPVFGTHNDHRMAMCLAPLVCVYQNIEIEAIEVVQKSFPSYWKEIEKLGVVIN
ncbi:MAG: 3-phosphoshikimate 1-carboxyvinyltransferase [Vicingaceae bacterium]